MAERIYHLAAGAANDVRAVDRLVVDGGTEPKLEPYAPGGRLDFVLARKDGLPGASLDRHDRLQA